MSKYMILTVETPDYRPTGFITIQEQGWGGEYFWLELKEGAQQKSFLLPREKLLKLGEMIKEITK